MGGKYQRAPVWSPLSALILHKVSPSDPIGPLSRRGNVQSRLF